MSRLAILISAALLAASISPALAAEPIPVPAPDFEALAFDAGADSGIQLREDRGVEPDFTVIGSATVCAAVAGGLAASVEGTHGKEIGFFATRGQQARPRVAPARETGA